MILEKDNTFCNGTPVVSTVELLQNLFSTKVWEIFCSIRIAGNFANQDILGSMEFVCNVAGSKLVVVLGHTKCGALKRWIRCSSN